MQVRLLKESDAEQYRELRLKGLKTDPEAFGSTYEMESVQSLESFEQKLVVRDGQFVTGGFDGDKLVCIASFIRRSGPKSTHKGELQAMYCDREYRGSGISREVVHFLIDRVGKMNDIEQLNLEVITENQRAKTFYESFGFIIYGTEPRAMFDGDRYYDEHKMKLEFED
ncbi:GNAT family N-acetyltransferase [Salinicoccus sp. YB14-2]|uniref:GNAT family N-acetyltransferase n=1 Tax=Salinicoccus sp. YB14-2 TaxID=1572701 RepID=UPI00068DEBF6|nr:GNAT family N-acetyltransferase [Salinicoccus sp. YB14-2]